MRCSINLIIFLAILFVGSNHHVGVNAEPSNVVDEHCSNCWRFERSKIEECQNIPTAEIQTLENNTELLSQNQALFPNVVSCLCVLSSKTDDILKGCTCSQEMGDGLKEQSSLISQQLCVNSTPTVNSPNNNSSSIESNTPSPSSSSSGATIVNSWAFSSILCLLVLLLFNH